MIKLINQIGKNCITLDDGEKISELIIDIIMSNEMVEIDFKGVQIITSVFVNGMLNEVFKQQPQFLSERVFKFHNLSKQDANTINNSIEFLDNYYNDEVYRKVADKIVERINEEK